MSVELATAYVAIVPSAQGMAKNLEDQLSGAAGPAGTKAGSTFATGFAKATAAVGGALFAKGVFSETQEAQKVAAQTEAVIKSTGNVARVSAQQMGDLANNISKTAGIDDELVQSAENLLRTFTNVQGVDVFSRTTQAAVDLGTAMHTGPESAAMLLGKALNDPAAGLTKLTRAGVTFTDQQKDQIAAMQKAGDLAGAQGIILAEVEREFGGSAAATATEADKASVAYKNMQESIGTALAPAFHGAASAAGMAAHAFGAQPPILVQLEAGAVAAAAGYVKLVKPMLDAGHRALDLAKNMDKAATATKVAQGAAVAGGFLILGKMLSDADKEAKTFAADLVLGLGDDPKAKAAALRASIKDLQDQAGKGVRWDVSSGISLFSDNGAKKANHNLRQVKEDLHAAEEQIAETGTKAEIMGLTTFTATQKAEIVTRRFGDAAKGTAGDVRDYASAVQAAHQANKNLLTSTTDQVTKDLALRSATRAATDAIRAYNDNQKAVAGNSDEENDRRAQAAETAIADARAYQDAVEALGQAEQAEEAAQRGVTASERAHADAVRTLSQAQQTLADDTAHNVDLVKDMAKAYDDAKVSLREMQEQASGDKRGVERAQIALDKALQAQREGPDPTKFDPNAQKSLDLDVADAKAALVDAQEAAADSANKLNDANKAGIDQSPQVLAVQDAISANLTKLQQDEDAVTRAQQGVIDSTQGIADAQNAAQSAHRATIKAHQDIADAAKKSRDDQRDAARDIAKMEDDARTKSGELRDAVVSDLSIVATTANAWGLGLAGVNAWLGIIKDGLAPGSPLIGEIDALLTKIQPFVVPGAVTGLTPAPGSGNAGASATASGTVNFNTVPVPIYGVTGAIIGYRMPDGTTVSTSAVPTSTVGGQHDPPKRRSKFYDVPPPSSQGRGDVLVDGDLKVYTDSRTGKELVRDVNDELGKRIR